MDFMCEPPYILLITFPFPFHSRTFCLIPRHHHLHHLPNMPASASDDRGVPFLKLGIDWYILVNSIHSALGRNKIWQNDHQDKWDPHATVSKVAQGQRLVEEYMALGDEGREVSPFTLPFFLYLSLWVIPTWRQRLGRRRWGTIGPEHVSAWYSDHPGAQSMCDTALEQLRLDPDRIQGGRRWMASRAAFSVRRTRDARQIALVLAYHWRSVRSPWQCSLAQDRSSHTGLIRTVCSAPWPRWRSGAGNPELGCYRWHGSDEHGKAIDCFFGPVWSDRVWEKDELRNGDVGGSPEIGMEFWYHKVWPGNYSGDVGSGRREWGPGGTKFWLKNKREARKRGSADVYPFVRQRGRHPK